MSLRLPVLVSGDSRNQQLQATNPETGAPLVVPLGATLIFTAKKSKYVPDSEAVFQKVTGAGITFSGSTLTVEIVSADTEPLDEYIDLVCDVQLQDAGLGILTIWEGVLPVRLGVTQETTTSVPVYTSNPPLPGGSGGDMFRSAYDSNADGKVNAADAADAVPWAGVSDKPATFPPAAHSHPLDELTQSGATDGDVVTWDATENVYKPKPQAAGPGGGGDMLKSVYDPTASGKVLSAVAADSAPWAGVSSKPATFPPSAHVHAQSEVTGLTTALAGKADGSTLSAHVADTANPHAVTKAQVGLALADNTPDAAKPISAATQTALNGKAASVHAHAVADVVGFAAAAASAAPVQAVAGLTGNIASAALRAALALVVGTDVQASNANLSAIAGLTTNAFGLSLLTKADAAAVRATIGAGTSSFDGAFASLSAKPTTVSGYGITDAQPLNAGLSAIAAISTAPFGLNLLTLADAAATRAAIGAGTSSFDGAFASLSGKPITLAGYGVTDAQPLNANLTSISSLSTTAYGRSVLTQADGAAVRALIGAGTSSFDGLFASLTAKPITLAGYGITDGQPLNSNLTSIAALATSAYGRGLLTQADAATARGTLGLGTASTLPFDTDATLSAASDSRLATQAALKSYVDNIATGLTWKASVRVATTANLTLSGTQTVDGVALVAGDRVLVKNQTTSSANGVYLVAAGTWTRSTDTDTASELIGATVMVREGSSNADTQWTCTNDAVTLGTTGIAFAQISGAGTYTADNSTLQISGNVFSVKNAELLALAGNATSGLWTRTGAGTGAARTLTGTANQITVTNGNGVAGNPTFALPQDIATTSSPTFGGATISGNAVSVGLTVSNSSTVGSYGAQVTLQNNNAIYNGVLKLFSDTVGSADIFGLNRQSLLLLGGTALAVAVGNLGNNPLVFGTNNAERMRIDATGNVGIGGTPQAKFHVFGSMRQTNTANTLGFDIGLLGGTSDATGYVYNRANAGLVFGVNGATAMQLDASGNVGIGVAPTGKLSVSKSNGGNVNGAANAAIYLPVDESTIQGPGTNTLIRMGGNLVLGGNGSMYFQTGGANQMTLDPSGNLGIGGTAAQKLHTWGAIQSSIPAGGAQLILDASTGTANTGSIIRFERGGTLKWDFGTGVSVGGDTFELYDRTGGISVMQVTPTTGNLLFSGKMGVGVSANAAVRLLVGGVGTTTNYGLQVIDSAAASCFIVRDDGLIQFSKVSSNTTASASNLYADNNGTLFKSTSSARYKTNIVNYQRGLADVLKLRPVSYSGISPYDTGKTFAGLLAEEVHAAGLTEYVEYDETGRPDALRYSQMVALLISAVRELAAR